MTPEEEAMSLGWRPQEQWSGPPEKWRDAAAFLEHGERSAAFVKKRLEAEYEGRFAKLESTANKALDTVVKKAEQEKAELLEQLKAKKAEAIADNDLAALEKVKEQIEEVKQTPAPDLEGEKAAKEFRAKHASWIDKDWVVQNFADGAAGRLANRGLSPPEFFKELDTQIREAFPEKFGRPKRNSAVEGDAPASEEGNGKTYADLPREAKQACDSFVKTIKGYKKEDYVKEYFGA